MKKKTLVATIFHFLLIRVMLAKNELQHFENIIHQPLDPVRPITLFTTTEKFLFVNIYVFHVHLFIYKVYIEGNHHSKKGKE